jgi:DNA-binding Lrp family transcriptional regulator
LDDIDRHLLALLQANARESAAVLARKLRLARTTVVARIARLEREGTIAGYGVRLGARIEQAAVRAYCGLRVEPRKSFSVIDALERLPEVEEVAAVSGEYDFMVLLRCDSNQQLDGLLDRILQFDGILQTYTSVILSLKIDRRSAVA